MAADGNRREARGRRTWNRVLLAWLTLLMPACVARSLAMSPRTVRDTIWYASARARQDGQDKRALAETVEYGAAVYERTNPHDPFTSALELTVRDSIRYTRDSFLSALADRVEGGGAPNDFAVLYVHGFGTGLGECWSNPLQARIRSGATVPWIAFCWPSHGSGITWPGEGSLVARAYEQDTTAVMASAPLFKQVLSDVRTAVGAPRMVLTAHSLGARLVGAVLTDTELTDSVPYRAVAFLAPDVDAGSFADTLLPPLRRIAQRVVLYSSRRDRALRISRSIHDSPRAGLAEPTPVLRDGLETVDITDGLNADGWWQRHFGNRHSIRRISGVMWDLVHVVGGEFAPSCRVRLGYGLLESNGSWRLLAGRYPDSTQLSTCARLGADVDPVSEKGSRFP